MSLSVHSHALSNVRISPEGSVPFSFLIFFVRLHQEIYNLRFQTHGTIRRSHLPAKYIYNIDII